MATTTDTSYDRASLPDHASDADDRQLAINKVGINELSYPIQVLDKNRAVQSTVAEISLSVGLPAEFKGTHMSRFIEVLNAVRGEMTVRNLPKILARIQNRLEANEAYIEVAFPYFISKKAPISGVESLMEYQCKFEASRIGEEFDFTLHVTVPVTSLCPCSKAISKYGAHNQRSLVDVQLKAADFLWIEDVVEAVESCASAPLFALLKREDEKYVTEQAYENPRFVEDLVRDTVHALRNLNGVQAIRVSASNAESIHNHAAFGFISWDAGSAGDTFGEPMTESTKLGEPGTTSGFGQWLRSLRSTRNFDQREFASHLGISASFLSRIESDSRQPSRELAQRIASLLGIPQDEAELRAGFAPTPLIPKLLSVLAD
jgi:GTP cyclohydrolase I